MADAPAVAPHDAILSGGQLRRLEREREKAAAQPLREADTSQPDERKADVSLVAAVPHTSRSLERQREKSARLLREASAIQPDERKCRGKVKLRTDVSKPVGPDNPHLLDENGLVQTRPCKNNAIRGGFVCTKHGGAAPQVRKKANKRLLAMVEPSIIRLEALIHQDEHMPTALGAIRTVLERAGSNTPIGPMAKETGEKDMRPIINIGIKVGGIETPVVSVGMQVLEGEVERDNDPDE